MYVEQILELKGVNLQDNFSEYIFLLRLLHKFGPNYEDEIEWLELNSKNILYS
jgi:hypothetical protein